MPLVDQFTRLKGFADEARANGYGDDEIDGVVRQKMKTSIDAGFSAGDVAKHLGAPEAKAPTFFEGLKRAGQAGVEDLGRTLLQTYKSLDPAQATSALEAGTAPLIAPLVASPPGAASIALGEAARKGAEQLGASPNLQAAIGTVANIATPGAIVPRAVRGAASRIAAPAQRTVSELLQNERAPVSRETPPPAAVIPEAPIVQPKPVEPAPVSMPSIEERIRTLELQNAELRGRQQAALEARQTPPQPAPQDVGRLGEKIPPNSPKQLIQQEKVPAPKPVEAPVVEAPKIEAQPAPIERPPAQERFAAAEVSAQAKLEEIRTRPIGRTNQQAVKAAADEHIRALTDTPAELEYKGKTYTGAEKIAGNNIRLKDDPDKVVRGANEILKVDEKIPFDVPTDSGIFAPGKVPFNEPAFAVVLKNGDIATSKMARSHANLINELKLVEDDLIDGGFVRGGKFVRDLTPEAKGIRNDAVTSAVETIIKPRPAIQQTPAGAQAMIPGAEARTVPNAPLRSRRAQTEKPMELEQPGIAAKEPGLFEKAPPGGFTEADRVLPGSARPSEPDLAARTAKTAEHQSRVDLAKSQSTAAKAETADDAIRRLANLDEQQISAYDPAASVHKVGRRWSYDTTNGNSHQGLYDTRREAIEAATRHKQMKLDQVQSPSDYYDITSLNAGERLKKIEQYTKEGMSEMDAGARARAEIVEPPRPKPSPSKNLVPEEIAAADEMTAMLGKNKPRKVSDILKSEKGSIRLGPLRMREGKPVEAPTSDEVKEAVSILQRVKSAVREPTGKRLTAGGLGEEATKTLSKTMGEEGAEMGRKAKAVRNDSDIEAGVARLPIKQSIKKLEGEERQNFVGVLDGKARPINDTVRETTTLARATLNKVADRASQVGLQIKLPGGEKIPFQPRENYFPHIGGKELGQVVKTENGRAMIKAKLKSQMEKGGKTVTDGQVEEALKNALKASKTRYGHLEMARIFDSDDWVKEPEMLLKYIDDAYWRIHIAEKFGADLEKGENLLTAIGMKKGDEVENWARKYFEKVTSTEAPGNLVVKKSIDAATSFQAGSKLGQAVLSNISQPVYTAVVAGAKNTVKGYGKALTKEGRDFGEKIIGDSWTDFLKDTGSGLAPNTKMDKFADTVLKYTGFTAAERLNRVVSANAGRYFAQDTLEKLIKNPSSKSHRRALEKMNVDVDGAIKRGALSEVDELKAGQSIVNRTQFKTDVTEIPLFWSSDAGRLITQFKKFQFKSGQMVKDEILAEMAKGNLKPFLRAAALLPIAGVGVAKLRDSVRFGEQTERKRNVADYLATVGTFGAFTDAFASSSKQPVRGLEYLAGPTLGDAGRAWEATAGLAGFMPGGAEGEWRPAAKLLARQIPVVGPSIRQLFNKEKPKREDTKMLEELGLKRERSSNKKLMKELGLE